MPCMSGRRQRCKPERLCARKGSSFHLASRLTERPGEAEAGCAANGFGPRLRRRRGRRFSGAPEPAPALRRRDRARQATEIKALLITGGPL